MASEDVLAVPAVQAGETYFDTWRAVRRLRADVMDETWEVQPLRGFGPRSSLTFLSRLLARDRDLLMRLDKETRIAASVAHPAIVRSLRVFSADDLAAVEVEYVEGTTLAAWRQRKPGGVCTVPQLEAPVRTLCSALDYAHRHDWLHGNLNPDAILIQGDGALKVLEFGIARPISEADRLVALGARIGALSYKSPQQTEGARIEPRDDVYSLGVILYELLTGSVPFPYGFTPGESAPPMAERLREMDKTTEPIPPEWEATIASCLADRAKRPLSVRVVAQRLGLELDPPTSPLPASTGPVSAGAPSTSGNPLSKEGLLASGSRRRTKRRVPASMRRLLYLSIGFFLVSLGLLAYFVFFRHAPPAPPSALVSATPALTPSPVRTSTPRMPASIKVPLPSPHLVPDVPVGSAPAAPLTPGGAPPAPRPATLVEHFAVPPPTVVVATPRPNRNELVGVPGADALAPVQIDSALLRRLAARMLKNEGDPGHAWFTV